MVIKRERLSSEIDDGSDHTVTFHCAICMEHKPTHSRRFCCGGCPHYFCFSCIVDHIGYRVLGGGDIHVPCPEPGCTIGELAYGKWYEHVTADVRRAWEVAILRDSAMLERCGSCGKFLEGVTMEGMMEGVKDDHHMDPLHSLAAAKGWRSCPRCGMLIELIGGCSIITCRCGCLFCYACAKISPKREDTVLQENQEMEEDDKSLIQESLRKHQEEQQNVRKANLVYKRNVRSKKDMPAGDNGSTSC